MTAAVADPADVGYGVVVPATVHFDDLDPVGMMHNSRYALVLERAMFVFWSEHGHSYRDGVPSTSDMVAAVREFNITYQTPIRGTGQIKVHFWLEKIGASSADYRFRFLSADLTTVHAYGRRLMVKVDGTGRPVRWTPEGRTLGERLLLRTGRDDQAERLRFVEETEAERAGYFNPEEGCR